jgi:hypothetical protein
MRRLKLSPDQRSGRAVEFGGADIPVCPYGRKDRVTSILCSAASDA